MARKPSRRTYKENAELTYISKLSIPPPQQNHGFLRGSAAQNNLESNKAYNHALHSDRLLTLEYIHGDSAATDLRAYTYQWISSINPPDHTVVYRYSRPVSSEIANNLSRLDSILCSFTNKRIITATWAKRSFPRISQQN